MTPWPQADVLHSSTNQFQQPQPSPMQASNLDPFAAFAAPNGDAQKPVSYTHLTLPTKA